MAKSLSVKVPTASVIALIEEKIAEIKALVATYPADVKQYEADVKAYQTSIVTLTINALKDNPELVGEEWDSPIRVSLNDYGNRSVDVRIDANALGFPEKPVKPTDPNQREWIGREHISRLELLEKNLRVLRMTTQEEVNASTYSSVMELL